MIKLLLNLLVLLALAALIVYFLPRHIKINRLERLADFVPTSVKEKAEDFLLTPAEKREKIVLKIEAELVALRATTGPEVTQVIPAIEALLEELKKKNGELSFAEIAKEKLIEQLLKKDNSATTTP